MIAALPKMAHATLKMAAGLTKMAEGRPSFCRPPKYGRRHTQNGRSPPCLLSLSLSLSLSYRRHVAPQVVMQLLQEARPEATVYDAIERFFPEGEAPAGGQRQEERAVLEAQESFRELVLELLQDPQRRRQYLQVPYRHLWVPYGHLWAPIGTHGYPIGTYRHPWVLPRHF